MAIFNSYLKLPEGTALQVKLFPDIGPSDVHFWDDGDCQAGIEQLQLEDLGEEG
jgi:hypothetical protein